MVEQCPLLPQTLGSIREEIVQHHVFELESLALVHCQTQRMLQHGWHSLLRLLIPHDNDLVTPELCLLPSIVVVFPAQ